MPLGESRMNIENPNKLELSLERAATEPAHRPEFCQILLESHVYVLGNTGQPPEAHGEISLEEGDNISIEHWQTPEGKPVIPFFSSLEVLSKAIEHEGSYLQLPVRSLFEMTLGATLFLNPKYDYGKEFVPDEVKNLLDTGVGSPHSTRTIEKETKVLLGQPANYPTQLIDSLTTLFPKHSEVTAAYLALMHDASVDEKPHLLIGLLGKGNMNNAIQAAGVVAGDTAPENEPVDLMVINSNATEGVSPYFLSTEPFYERKWGQKLKGFFSSDKA